MKHASAHCQQRYTADILQREDDRNCTPLMGEGQTDYISQYGQQRRDKLIDTDLLPGGYQHSF